jgi:uncharacterized protein (TIGR02466 family)
MVTWEAIFPTPVMRTSIGRPFTAEERDFFASKQANPHPNICNTRSADTHVLNAPELQPLRSIVIDCVYQFGRKVISPNPAHEFYLTQSWLNYTKPGESHHRHHHTNSLISGVLYVSAHREADGISFFRGSMPQIMVTEEGLNWYNAPSWTIPVASGDLVLFPSQLMHGVEQTSGDHIRVSVAFNAFVRGNIGSEESLNSLGI